MSNCMTIADESIDQRDTCAEIAPKDIVEFILEEVLLSALLISDKGYSRIGDFNITEDFCQQYDRLPYPKDFEQVNYTGTPEDQESNLTSARSADRTASVCTAKGNLEHIIDSFVKKEEKSRPSGECTIITEEDLADNELQIQNGQSHTEYINNRGKCSQALAPREYFDKKDVITNEKIEIQYYNEGKLSKIYVPLIPTNIIEVGTLVGANETKERQEDESEGREDVNEEINEERETNNNEDDGTSFKPFAVEEFPEVLSDGSIDPNRPRACAFGEEDVKKIIKEIAEISFSQSHANSEDFDLAYHPDGQGDADLESKSLTKSKDSLEKLLMSAGLQEEICIDSSADLEVRDSKTNDYLQASEEAKVLSSEGLIVMDHNRKSSSEKSISEESAHFLLEQNAFEPERKLSECLESLPMTEKSDSQHSAHFLPKENPFEAEKKPSECLGSLSMTENSISQKSAHFLPEQNAFGAEKKPASQHSAHFLPQQNTIEVEKKPSECLSMTENSVSQKSAHFLPEQNAFELEKKPSECLPMAEKSVSQHSANFLPKQNPFEAEKKPSECLPMGEKSDSQHSTHFLPQQNTTETEKKPSECLDNLPTGESAKDNNVDTCPNLNLFSSNIKGEHHLQYEVTDQEFQINSRLYSNWTANESESADQKLEETFSIDVPPERKNLVSENSPEPSGPNEVETDANMCNFGIEIEEPQSDHYSKDSHFWRFSGISEGSKQDLLTEKNHQLTSERAEKTSNESIPDTAVGGIGTSDMQDTSKELNYPLQHSSVSLAGYSPESVEDYGLKRDFETNDFDSFLQGADSYSDWYKSDSQVGKNFETSFETLEKEHLRFQPSECLTYTMCKGGDTSNSEIRNFEDGQTQDGQMLQDGSTPDVNKIPEIQPENEKRAENLDESPGNDTNAEIRSTRSPSSSQVQPSAHSLTDSDVAVDSSISQTASHNFKLHSQKMYSGVNHEPDVQSQQECTLTESEEAFIDQTESVLQIIEPEELSGDEDSTKVSFSLLSEISQGESSAPIEDEPSSSPENNKSSETVTTARKVYSGMTTIGPLKNTDYDPKDLSITNIDYGKMTRITSSRQLAKELDLFGPDLSGAASVKIVEDDSDNDIALNIEDDHLELTSLVNRDIASLTKVQKVREVMSHQPKPEDDFEDEDSLPRPRLDLKDVESMTDDRYKVPDVSLPLLSLEISDSDGPEKELIENMGLVLSSLTNPVFYEEEFEDDGSDAPQDIADAEYLPKVESQTSTGKQKSETSTKVKNEDAEVEEMEEEPAEKDKQLDGILPTVHIDSQHDNEAGSPRYGTLGSVFRKASSKFIRKDSDMILRNSKSLPRDTNKITATESIRSILDDCQSSASNMLKKSKSLLKNTQSIFKSKSSSRMSPDQDSGSGVEKKKVSPSESDVTSLERKLSNFLRKEEFTKAKNLIKSKVEKTLKLDSGSSTTEDDADKKDLRVAIRDEEKLRIDRMENFRKVLPKSPLVYKSQFVKSQISMQNCSSEAIVVESNTAVVLAYTEQTDGVEGLVVGAQSQDSHGDVPLLEGQKERISAEEAEIQKPAELEMSIPLPEKSSWSKDMDELVVPTGNEEPEPPQPEYIVMETVQGLPTTDLDSPSSDKENIGTENREQTERDAGYNMKKAEASNSLQGCAEGMNDIMSSFPESEEEKIGIRTPSERKLKAKKKKLTARFRSFWYSAFGKVKTPPKKGDQP